MTILCTKCIIIIIIIIISSISRLWTSEQMRQAQTLQTELY